MEARVKKREDKKHEKLRENGFSGTVDIVYSTEDLDICCTPVMYEANENNI